MSAALLAFLVFFCAWIFLEIRKTSPFWLRVPSGLLTIAALFVFSFYGFFEYFGYCAGVQTQMIQGTKYLAEDVGPEAALDLLDSYVPKIKERKNIPAAMHSLLLDFEKQADNLRKKKPQQSGPDNPRPPGASDRGR